MYLYKEPVIDPDINYRYTDRFNSEFNSEICFIGSILTVLF